MGEHPDIVTNEENKLFLNSVVPEDTEMSTTLTANEWNSIQAHALFLIRQKQARKAKMTGGQDVAKNSRKRA